MARLRRKACVALCLFTLFIFGTLMGLRTLKPSDGFSDLAPGLDLQADRGSVSEPPVQEARAPRGDTKASLSISGPDGTVFEDVHIFYHAWFGSPHMDGKYIHWDHILVPHWDPKVASSYPRGRHAPPEDIGSSFYPELNPYSSRDPDVLESHMEQIGSSAAGRSAARKPTGGWEGGGRGGMTEQNIDSITQSQDSWSEPNSHPTIFIHSQILLS